MKFIIYKITNTVNGKIYVGKHQTEDLDDGYMGSGKHLKHALNKYGRDKFRKEILHEFDSEEEMNAKEKELVTEEFCKRRDTYNLCEGGKGGWSYINRSGLGIGRRFTAESSYKVAGLGANAFRKRYETDSSFRDNINVHLKNIRAISLERFPQGTLFGKHHSEETKRKMQVSMNGKQTGSKNSQFGSMWITDGVLTQKVKKDSPIPNGWRRGRC